MSKPLHPSPYKPTLASCEVCWADSSETTIMLYRRNGYENSTYCEQHFYEVKQLEKEAN